MALGAPGSPYPNFLRGLENASRNRAVERLRRESPAVQTGLQANAYTGEVTTELIFHTAKTIGDRIVVIQPDGKMKVDKRLEGGGHGVHYLLYMTKPDTHYRWSP